MRRGEFLKLFVSGISAAMFPVLIYAGKNDELPDVLLIGDSISIGYTPFVKELLKGKANVYRPMINGEPENCSGTTFGAANIDRWIEKKKWSVIHFNFGLHDLKHVDPISGAGSRKQSDPLQADPKRYARNLKSIVNKLKKTDAILIFATTTPVPVISKNPLRESANVPIYNKTAIKIMKREKVLVNDLFTKISPKIGEYQLPNNVHFKQEGYKALADLVVKEITAVL